MSRALPTIFVTSVLRMPSNLLKLTIPLKCTPVIPPPPPLPVADAAASDEVAVLLLAIGVASSYPV
jgi:hypothetical protein